MAELVDAHAREPMGVGPDAAQNGRALRQKLLAAFRSSPALLTGVSLMVIVLLIAVFGPLAMSYTPLQMDYAHRLAPPSLQHPFGTDSFGRDLMSRVVSGAGLSLLIGVSVVIINVVFGTVLGVFAGYYQRLSGPIMRLMDALMAFPAILLALAIAASLGSRVENVIIALGVVYVPRSARLVRAAVLTVKNADYVEAARVANASDFWIITRHILPNCFGPLIVQFSFVFAYAVLAEAALSFLGAGPPPPTPTWGNIIAEGRDVLVEAPWTMAFPGIAISITVLGLTLAGDGLRDVLDPRIAPEL